MSCYIPHLYDAQQRHVKPEPVPTFAAERIRADITDEQAHVILGAAWVILPLLMAVLCA